MPSGAMASTQPIITIDALAIASNRPTRACCWPISIRVRATANNTVNTMTGRIAPLAKAAKILSGKSESRKSVADGTGPGIPCAWSAAMALAGMGKARSKGGTVTAATPAESA